MKSLIYLLAITLIITIQNGHTQPIVTDGLVSYWTFDEKDIAGFTAKDVWGENDGRIVGNPKVVDGQVGEALEFDGANDYVNLTNLGDFGEKSAHLPLKLDENQFQERVDDAFQSP